MSSQRPESPSSLQATKVSATSRATRALGLTFLSLALMAALLAGYDIWTNRVRAEEAASKDLRNLTLVISSKLSGDYTDARVVVDLMAAQIAPAAMQADQVERHQGTLRPWLGSLLQTVSQASALRYFDAEGHRLYSTVAGETPVNIASREFFRQLQRNPSASPVYSEVALGRYSNRVTQYIAKPVLDPAGRFLGVALAAIDLTAVQDEFQKLDLGPRGIVVLRRLDNGAQVVRHPGLVEVSNAAQADAILAAVRQPVPAGSVTTTSLTDGVQRRYGYRVLEGHPLFVAVGLAEDDYLALWRQSAALTLMMCLAFAGVLAYSHRRLADAAARRERNEYLLRSSEARLHKLIEDNHAVILQIDPRTGRILDANASACAFYGWPKAELCAKSIQDINLLPPDQVAAERQLALQQKRNYFIFEHRLADDSARTVEVHSTPLTVESGPLLVSIIHDVSDRQRAEQELKRMNKDFVTLLESTTDFIYFKDRDSRFRFCSQTLARITGHGHWREMVGKHDQDVFAPELAAVYQEEERPVFEKGTALLGRVDPFVDEFGAPGWVSTNKWPMFDEDGNTVIGIFGISRVVTDQKRLENELHALAMTDSLTGAATRREFDACLNRELARLRREPQLTCSMLMFDLDRFKAVNDQHGHGAGDAVLRHVARLVTGSIRHGDVLGRLGGEEFGLLLPGSDAADAQVFAERLRHIVAATPCKVGTTTVTVTVSVGVAQLRSVDAGPERPMARADQAMYEAKHQGRNRVAAARD